MKRVGVLVGFVLLPLSCTTEETFEPDLSLIRPWSPELSRMDPLPRPFTVSYERGSRSLCFAAVAHAGSVDSPTFRLVEGLFEGPRPDVVLLEGFPSSEGMNPERMVRSALDDGEDGRFRGGEVAFAIRAAVLRDIPFVGGEPDETFIHRAVLEAGFSTTDLLGYYLIRQIPQWRRAGTLEQIGLSEAWAPYGERLGALLELEPEQVPDLTSLREWYRAGNGTELVEDKIESGASAPMREGDLLTQRIGAEVSHARDRHILETLASLLYDFERILVVYGGSHWSTKQFALAGMMGEPVRVSSDPCWSSGAPGTQGRSAASRSDALTFLHGPQLFHRWP